MGRRTSPTMLSAVVGPTYALFAQQQQHGRHLLLACFGEKARGMLENAFSSAWDVLVAISMDLEDRFWVAESWKDVIVQHVAGSTGVSRADMTWRQLERVVEKVLKHRPKLASYLIDLIRVVCLSTVSPLRRLRRRQ